ncbi:hypothetical protein ABZT26_35340 [Streptomyces sp. NPDC005395]|uniref:hypothetical protein n=1 Tax=Streptomyces sp. NPDC005395 TaxID=3157042 RepID=UPI00339E11BA
MSDDAPHPYTEAALARLMLSDAYRQVAERALQGITTRYDGDHFAGGGSYVEEAAALVRQAEEVLRWAVVYERERHSSWEEIGQALDVTRQSAHERFADRVARWRAPLDKPEHLRSDGTPADERIPASVRYVWDSSRNEASMAEETALELDTWLKDHTAPYDSWADDEHPVADRLPRHSTDGMVALLGRITRRLLEEQMAPDPRREADVCERRAALYERMLREETAVPEATIREWIEKDRARAAVLRATPGTGVPWPTDVERNRSSAADEAQ